MINIYVYSIFCFLLSCMPFAKCVSQDINSTNECSEYDTEDKKFSITGDDLVTYSNEEKIKLLQSFNGIQIKSIEFIESFSDISNISDISDISDIKEAKKAKYLSKMTLFQGMKFNTCDFGNDIIAISDDNYENNVFATVYIITDYSDYTSESFVKIVYNIVN